ncbi:hypothetical protein VTJ49DRAFT_938 [Mycothermus thermophilus]|uniref:Uncharacterized protein n=1 Tax=Humicola insolens TaxID=85995 RepID=A0ABR3VDR6_HUMIN
MWFARWGREHENPNNLYLVKIYARDYYYKFLGELQKIWYAPLFRVHPPPEIAEILWLIHCINRVPEKSKYFSQIDNKHLTDGQTMKCQASLDQQVARYFGISKPHTLFSRHKNMSGMDFLPKGSRFNEMVLTPNVMEALFVGEMIPLPKAEALWNSKQLSILDYHCRIREWNIKLVDATIADFQKHGERYS